MQSTENYKIQEINTERLHQNSWNPFSMTPETFEGLVQDVIRRGVQYPVTVRTCNCSILNGEHFEIIDGEHRYYAVLDRRVDLKTIPCRIEDVDDVEARLETVNLNRLRGEQISGRFENLVRELQTKYNLSKEQIAEGLHMKIEALQLELQPINLATVAPLKMDLKARIKVHILNVRIHSLKEMEFVNEILRKIMEKEDCDQSSALLALCHFYKEHSMK